MLRVTDPQCTSTGEGAGLGTSQTKSPQILNIDIPFDGLGLISIPASETISPVFTMWITLVAMYTGMLMTALLFVTTHQVVCYHTPSTSSSLMITW